MDVDQGNQGVCSKQDDVLVRGFVPSKMHWMSTLVPTHRVQMNEFASIGMSHLPTFPKRKYALDVCACLVASFALFQTKHVVCVKTCDPRHSSMRVPTRLCAYQGRAGSR